MPLLSAVGLAGYGRTAIAKCRPGTRQVRQHQDTRVFPRGRQPCFGVANGNSLDFPLERSLDVNLDGRGLADGGRRKTEADVDPEQRFLRWCGRTLVLQFLMHEFTYGSTVR
jgi:hypothetical protein